MEQYINKDDIIAEINKRIKEISKEFQESEYIQYTLLGKINALENLLPFLDTLEIKEVNLEKEFDNYVKEKDILACDVQFEPFTHLYKCAKYFFELGLKAQKGE